MFDKIRNNPNRVIIAICWIFLLHYILITLFQIQILPSFSISLGNIILPPFQTTQILLVFPLIILTSYILFIRNNIISWKDLGFYKGKNGLLSTVSLGLSGGLIIGIFNYFTISYFILRKNVLPNFIEKCIFAPIWEEFFYRVLLLTILEFSFLTFLKIKIFDNPKYKEKFDESKKRVIIIEIYVLIIILNATFFVYGHGVISSLWIFLGGIIMAIVYLKTKSIITPIIVHSMSNFVTGGFLFLIINRF